VNISVFGLGYIGCVLSAAFIKMGHSVKGVDIISEKVDKINSHQWPIFETGLDEVWDDDNGGSMHASTNPNSAVEATTISFVCVGTPANLESGVDLRQLKSTMKEIGTVIAGLNRKHLIVIRSTIPPGTVENEIIPILCEESGLKEGENFELCYYPEFLREGSAMNDMFNPSLNVIGLRKGFPMEVMEEIYSSVPDPFIQTSIRTSEMLKYVCNSFHGLKVAFANEIGALCKEYEVDGTELMEYFSMDTTLNISKYYLRPGFAYGGSCLPKELRAISNFAREKNVEIPLLKSISKSNEEQINRLVSILVEINKDKVGIYGVTFKPDTDDIRESPILIAVDNLFKMSTDYRSIIKPIAFDSEMVAEKISSHFSDKIKMVTDVNEILKSSDVLILGPAKIDETILDDIVASGKIVIDLKWHKVNENMKSYENYIPIV